MYKFLKIGVPILLLSITTYGKDEPVLMKPKMEVIKPIGDISKMHQPIPTVGQIVDKTTDNMLAINQTNLAIGQIVDKTTDNVSATTQTNLAVNKVFEKPIIINSLNKGKEIIEIKNVTDKPINISGWSILSVLGEQVYTFPEIIIQPNSIISVGDSGKNPNVNLHWLEGRGVWNNTDKDPAELYNAVWELIDRYDD
ncbi:hypothetical protein AN639_04135 [Candidatus Epulonipiscium fishelsonii]|uniref:Uncharacterized protein n=1 Tax=Candidatus Epulonipiscium fishelsonii TaxID=77094 RepID=A0ACC8XH02_9FIRM|nr:hypothetical protein AN639_04135 [Epulopiscium sp. SCG-B05WGA-EpuloA1]ONI42849.1 hypothetical protein AN396_13015 [Epulopiscium sp. SCG-B11WGA-EpuloA1]ONI47593.1 hypothetical protein AN644_04675 [Epulopiscium sp. SCG-C06WGA-EpuloA1]